MDVGDYVRRGGRREVGLELCGDGEMNKNVEEMREKSYLCFFFFFFSLRRVYMLLWF